MTKPRSKAPVFVLGCSRSGTTLLYHMLLSAGNFAVYRMESQVLNLLEPRFRPLDITANKRRMLDAWYDSRLYTRSGLMPEEIEPRIMAECRNGGDFLRILMEEICRKQGVERWAETTPDHLLYLDRIKQTIPDALIVHVIRDGRDAALSWEKRSQIRRLPGDWRRPAIAAAIYWEWFVTRGQKMGAAFPEDYVEVHYEDLVRTPDTVLKRLEPFVQHDLNYERIKSVAIGSVASPNTAFKDDPRSPIGRWQTDLSAAELDMLESLTGDTLLELGYSLGSRASRKQELAFLRSTYRSYFATKFYLKTKTPAGKWLVTRDLSWV
ncbi:MAG TPA: sulfotransferase [Terriglobales bacterium]|nr:sulfotransferase [Terriglobales bacterium]